MMPPENLMAAMSGPTPEQVTEMERQRAIQIWYELQMTRLETEHRERVLRFGAILCRCLQHEPCQVHSTVHISMDGRVL